LQPISIEKEATMKPLTAVAVLGAAFAANTCSALASDIHLPADRSAGPVLHAAAPCATDMSCGTKTLPDGFVADGEWNPTTQLSGFVTTSAVNTVVVIDGTCQEVSTNTITGADFPGPITRAFAWGVETGDSWVGSWRIPPAAPDPKLYHLDASFNVLAVYSFPDPGTGLDMQFSGLAMDEERGHLWAILRNNPAGTVSRLVEFDISVDPPVILQGPIDAPWPGGASAISSAGLEYRSEDCTLIALRQDANNLGETSLVTFQDADPAGTTQGVTLLGDCSIENTPCVGAGASSNRPWGIAVVEDAAPHVIYSDLNLDATCGVIEQPADFHLVELPPVTGICLTPVEPSTWGRIKSRYTR
jgi:hypothetical protein